MRHRLQQIQTLLNDMKRNHKQEIDAFLKLHPELKNWGRTFGTKQITEYRSKGRNKGGMKYNYGCSDF